MSAREGRALTARRAFPLPGAPVLLAAALAVVFFAFWAGVTGYDLPGDLLLYFDYANYIGDGFVPYRDFPLEYPPFALVPILLAFAFGRSYQAFETVFAIEMYALAVVVGLLSSWLARRALPSARAGERGWRMAAYVAAFPLLGQIVTTRFDLAPVALTLGALALWLAGRERFAWAALALGVATKFFPAVLAPLFAIDLLCRRGLRGTVSGGLFFVTSCALAFAPGLLMSPSGLWRAVTYHSERGTQIESLYANGLLLLNRLTGFPVGTDHVFGGYEAISAWTDELKLVSVVVQVVTLGAVWLAFGWRAWRDRDSAEASRPARLTLATTLTLAVFIATGKVFSPQYLIWLMPLIVLAPGRSGRWAIGLFFGALLFSQFIYPHAYDHVTDRDALGVALLTARNVLFLGMIVGLVVAFRREHAAPTR